jgi:hypothetical protein
MAISLTVMNISTSFKDRASSPAKYLLTFKGTPCILFVRTSQYLTAKKANVVFVHSMKAYRGVE